MITVADILAIPAFEKVDIIAPIQGAGERRVCNVGILDCPPAINQYSVYMPGEFILTNLGFCYGDPELSDRSLITMMERGVAAIAVKRVYGPCFTDAVREASERLGVPVYLYSGAYHEMVAYLSLNLLQRDLEASDKSGAVDEFLDRRSKKSIRREINALTGLTGAALRCIAISAEKDDRCSLYAIQDNLNDLLEAFRKKHDEVEGACAFRYHDALLAFVSYGSERETEEVYDDLMAAIQGVGVVHCGMGDLVALGEADISVRQATILLAEAHIRGVRYLGWADLGADAFTFAAQLNPMFILTARSFKLRLQKYDEENGTELVETARAFAFASGDIVTTARLLMQHPNTARYRLKRIRSLLDLEGAADREMLPLLTLIFLDEMRAEAAPTR